MTANEKVKKAKELMIGTGRALALIAFGYLCNVPVIIVKSLVREDLGLLNHESGKRLYYFSKFSFSLFNYVAFPICIIMNKPALRRAVFRDFKESRLSRFVKNCFCRQDLVSVIE